MIDQDSDLNRRILVIDDNHAIHEDFRKILCKDEGYDLLTVTEELLFGGVQGGVSSGDFEVVCADQGQTGLALVQKALEEECPFAVVFVDMRMPPGWDGVETIEQLWKTDSNLQVVICTAYSDHQWDQMTERLGHSEKLLILRKPFDLIEIQQLADSLTHKWNLERKDRQHVKSLVRAERSLQQALAETESLVTAISSILIGIDHQNHIVRWNGAAERTFGFSASIMVGRTIQSSGIHWDWNFMTMAMQDCRRQQLSRRIPELGYLDSLGKKRYLEMTLSPITGENGTVSGILILGNDITQQKDVEAQLAIAQKMESIGQLAAGVAHEINTPLHYITENIRFLKESFHDLRQLLESYDDLFHRIQALGLNSEAIGAVEAVITQVDPEYLLGEIPRVLAQSLEGTDRVTEIVRAMNEFSHPGTGEKTAVDLNHSLQSAITLLSKEWKDVAEIVSDFAIDLPLVRGFPSQLTQVWLNLIVNAAHAIQERMNRDASESGTIWVTTQQDGEWAEVQFSDTGCGIPESIQSQVFDLFFTTKDIGKGTGQGLALAHSIIVKKHGGMLTFKTQPGAGSTFVVRLPLELVGVESISG